MSTAQFPWFIQELTDIKQRQATMVAELIDNHVPASTILARIAEGNDEIHRCALDEAVATMTRRGMEDPPVSVTLLVMGSLGRGESFLDPDQDNGFILGDYPDEDHDRIDAYFIPLAEAFNASLDRIGYPLCSGQVMARNPVWRKSKRQWLEQVQRWTIRRGPVAARFGNLLYDFRIVAGPRHAARELRHSLAQLGQNDIGALLNMCREAPLHDSAVGFFGQRRAERSGPQLTRVDLKTYGLLPLVASVRLWALRHGVEEAGTLARIERLGAFHVIETGSSEALTAAFDSVAGAILRQEVRDLALLGQPPSNLVPPAILDRHDHDALVDGLHVIDHFAKETRAAFAGEPY